MPSGSVRIFATRSADLLAEQHAAAARLRALPDHDLDRVGAAQVVRVEAVARRQALIDQRLRGSGAPPRVMPPSPVVVVVPDRRRRAAERLLRVGADSAPKLMPAMVIGIFELDRLLREARAEHDVGRAFLAIAFERIARQRRAEEHQIVEVRHLALGAEAADLVEPVMRHGGCRDRILVEGRGAARRRMAARNSQSGLRSDRRVDWTSTRRHVEPSVGVGVSTWKL